MMRHVLAAVAVGVVLGVIVAAVLMFTILDVCDLTHYGPALVAVCVGREPVRLWPPPPGTVHELDTPPQVIGRAGPLS